MLLKTSNCIIYCLFGAQDKTIIYPKSNVTNSQVILLSVTPSARPHHIINARKVIMRKSKFNGINIFGLQLIWSLVPPDRRDTVTTAEACETVVKPLTAEVSVPRSCDGVVSSSSSSSSLSFSDALGSGAVFAERGGRSMVRETADVFVSHAWQDNFSHVLAALLVRFLLITFFLKC